MLRRLLFVFFIIALFGQSSSVKAQERNSISRKWQIEFEKAKQDYQTLELDEAIDKLIRITSRNDSFGEAWLLLGYCYQEKNQKENEFEAFKKALNLDSSKFKEILIPLAELSYFWGRYTEAKEFLDSHTHGFTEISQRVDFALAEKNKDLSGIEVLSVSGMDSTANYYFPSLTIDGRELIFTKQDVSEEPGNRPGQEDLYAAVFNGTDLLNEKPIQGYINTIKNEGTQTLRYDGRLMFFTACSYPDSKGGCDIYYTTREQGTWQPAKNIGNPINSRYWESTPCLSPDGRSLYFASNRPGGYGGMDIWQSQYIEGEGWQVPTNLGDVINSQGDELAPFLHSDGRSLYFASSGHIGMGQLDLFLSHFESMGGWKNPVNLGYPVNTHKNEFGISIPGSGDYALFASERDDNGTRKIFRYNLIPEHQPQVVSFIKGRVVDSLSLNGLEAILEIREFSGALKQSVSSDRVSGDFVIGLPQDNQYVMIVQCRGYFFYSKAFRASQGINSKLPEMLIKLKPLKPETNIIMRNIFFEFDSAILSEKSNGEIFQITKLLNDNPTIRIEISGHTDSLGSEDYNKNLSLNRAKSLKIALIKKGVSSVRMLIRGEGSSNPLTGNDTESGRALNRRTEIKIII